VTSPTDVPPELKGAIGNVTGATAVAPMLAPAPVPNAVQTTPGVSPAQQASGFRRQASGPDPDPDMGAMALMAAQMQAMANEMFGVSVVPLPLAPQQAAMAGGSTSPPMSPGITTTMPETTSGPSYAPGVSAAPFTSAKPDASPFGTPTDVGGFSPSPESVAVPRAPGSAPHTPSSGSRGPGSELHAPSSEPRGPSSEPRGPSSGTVPHATNGASSQAASRSTGTVPHATNGASPAARSTSDEISTGGNPFSVAPTFDALAYAGTMNPGGMPGQDLAPHEITSWRPPVITAPPKDAPPSYLPDLAYPTSLGAIPDASVPEIRGLTSETSLPEARGPRSEAPVSDPRFRAGGTPFNPYLVRRDFPILEERVHGKRLVWLDNAATTQKPKAVIDRLTYYYEHENSNIHRAAHALAARATDAYEKGRESVRRFLNAPSAEEIIFVRGATEGINLVAQSWGRRNIGKGDEIVLTHLEHHANIVPWQMLCAEKGARLRIAPVDARGDVIVEEYEKLFNPRTRLAAFTQVSNALGTITPAKEMIQIARRYGATVLLDGAQAVSHMRVDVQDLDCDFYVFSGHKVFAPTGIGAVWGKRDVLAAMPPWQGGGNMIQDVTFEKTVYQAPPWRFEAGTGNIADAVGLGEALDYVMKIGMDTIDRYEHELLVYATERLATVPGLTMIGTAPKKAGVLSFVLDGQRTEDVGAMLDKEGIAVRSGHHCAQPILRRYGLEASVRASLAFYNVCEDIDALVEAHHRIQGGRSGAH
jgi:cysteine desulfurase/selenocysteine lyase